MKNGGKSQTDQKIEGDREQVEDEKSTAGEKKTTTTRNVKN